MAADAWMTDDAQSITQENLIDLDKAAGTPGLVAPGA
jgi:hypothetical protein